MGASIVSPLSRRQLRGRPTSRPISAKSSDVSESYVPGLYGNVSTTAEQDRAAAGLLAARGALDLAPMLGLAGVTS